MARIYCKGKPMTPPIVGGVTFSLFDFPTGLWSGMATTEQETAMCGAGSPFFTQSEIDRFQADIDAVTAVAAGIPALETTSVGSAEALGAQHEAVVAATIAHDAAVAAKVITAATLASATSLEASTAATLATATSTHDADAAALALDSGNATLIAAEAASAAILATATTAHTTANNAKTAATTADGTAGGTVTSTASTLSTASGAVAALVTAASDDAKAVLDARVFVAQAPTLTPPSRNGKPNPLA